VNSQLQALLTLQEHDDQISRVEGRLAALGPRAAALDAERAAAERAVSTARSAVEREEQRQRELGGRAEEFRRLNARAVSQMDQVRKVHEANAATAQVDITRRALSEVETEIAGVAQRLAALRTAVDNAEYAVAALEERQAAAREELATARGELETNLAGARARRQKAAADVDRATLTKYDRVRSRRRSTSVYPMRGTSCSHCDTTVPTQRRTALLSGGAVDVCESCGVLLYAAS